MEEGLIHGLNSACGSMVEWENRKSDMRLLCTVYVQSVLCNGLAYMLSSFTIQTYNHHRICIVLCVSNLLSWNPNSIRPFSETGSWFGHSRMRVRPVGGWGAMGGRGGGSSLESVQPRYASVSLLFGCYIDLPCMCFSMWLATNSYLFDHHHYCMSPRNHSKPLLMPLQHPMHR